MPKQDVDDQQSAEVAVMMNTELLAQFAEMAVAIPREDGDGTEAILTQILNAQTWEELDSPWETSPLDDILGKRLKLTRATRRPSTFDGGLGQFLVLHLLDPKDGKTYVKTTGSISVVGQVAVLYFRQWMPALIEWRRADRPSANGYYPQHLVIHDVFTGAQDDAS